MSQTDRATLLVVAAGVVVVALLALLVVSGVSRPFDDAVAGIVRHPDLMPALAFLRPVTELGSTWAVTAVAALVILVGLAIGPWIHGVIGAAVIAGASIGNALLKAFVGRARPDLLDAIVSEPGFSFPSGHAALGMVAWGVMAVLVSRTRIPRPLRLTGVSALVLLVALIGLSRVYLGVHFATDVLAGWTAGAVVVVLYARLTRGVSREPAVGAVDADQAAPRSGRSAGE